MDEMSDELRADERGDEPLFPLPSIVPDKDTQILETWFKVAALAPRVERLEQEMQQLAQDVAVIRQGVSSIGRQQSFEGRPVNLIIADIARHLGFDPVTSLPKD